MRGIDLLSNFQADILTEVAVLNSDTDSTAVDLSAYRGCTFYALLGESADTLDGSNYIELEVEESTDNSTFTDAADGDIRNAVTGTNTGTFALINAATEDQLAYSTQYLGTKRYARVVINFTGTHTTGIPITIFALRSVKNQLPV